MNPKVNQHWIFIGRTDAETEAQISWPSDVKSRLIGKDFDAGKGWRKEEKGTMEDEMFGWHHRLNGHEFEPALGDGDGQGSLVCCSPWGCKELDVTEELNNNNIYNKIMQFATTWIGPENILLSEVSQPKNDKYYDIFYKWNLKIIQKNIYTKQKESHVCRKQTWLATWRGQKGQIKSIELTNYYV